MLKTSDQKMESPHENPVHPSDDRRQHVWVTRRMLLLLGALALTPVAAAWVQYVLFGLPEPALAASTGGRGRQLMHQEKRTSLMSMETIRGSSLGRESGPRV